MNYILLFILWLSGGVVLAEEKKSPYFYLGEITIGYKYQFLQPDDISKAYVETVGLNLLSIELNPQKASWGNKWLKLFLPKLTYEFTPGNSAEQDELIALNQDSNNASTRFAADLNADIGEFFNRPDRHFLVGYYDRQAFLYNVQSLDFYWFFSDNRARLLLPGDEISVATVFEQSRLGYRQQRGRWQAEIGAFQLRYQKPLLSPLLTSTDALFESQLNSQGIYLGAGYQYRENSGVFLNYNQGFQSDIDLVEGFSQAYNPDKDRTEDINFSAWQIDMVLASSDFGLKRLPLQLMSSVIYRDFEGYNDDLIYSINIIYQVKF